jgi:hypothetical protein
MKLIKLASKFVDRDELAYARLDEQGRYQVFVRHCNGPAAIVSRLQLKGLIVIQEVGSGLEVGGRKKGVMPCR